MNPNTAEFYDSWWGSNDATSYLHDRQLDEIAAHIVDRIGDPPKRLMDLGGGISRLARLARIRGHVPFVVDFSRIAVDEMQAEGIGAMCYDISRWYGAMLMQDVDVVTCCECLEHLSKPQLAIRCARAHSGWAFFSVPNARVWAQQPATHMRRYDILSLTELLRQAYKHVEVIAMHKWLVAECHA